MAKSDAQKMMAKLMKLDGAVQRDYDPYMNVLRCPSPSFNFTFGNSWGLPLGYTLAIWGPPKGGKSVVINSMIGQMHRDYPDAYAIKFNTEMRELVQLTDRQMDVWGIDRDRYIAYETNRASGVFDVIEKNIAEAVEGGMNVKMVAIDSLNSIMGRRTENANTVDQQQIGDKAQTYGDGLARILPTLRKYRIGLVLSLQQRQEMDQHEIKRGHIHKMAGANAVQHFAEYFMYIAPDKTKKGRQDLLENDLVNKQVSDLKDKAEQTAHRIYVNMRDSSVGPKGRWGGFIFSDKEGIVNTHEEVFLLGTNRGVIERPNQLTYSFNGNNWAGKKNMIEELRKNPDLCSAILTKLREMDIGGGADDIGGEDVPQGIVNPGAEGEGEV